MIYITGDVHGDVNRFSPSFMPGEDTWTEENYVIVCGDFGFVFVDNDAEKSRLDFLAEKPYTILWIDGNHENFDALYRYPVETWNGGSVHRIRNNILHLMRGQIFTVEGKTFFTFGGAYSIDRSMRIKGTSYWEEELPNREEYDEAIRSLKESHNTVDYILTHTAPREMIQRLGFYPDPRDMELTGFLEWIMYQVTYKQWFFGHFHEDKTLDEKHHALYYDVTAI